jgi:hypothetical protein
MHRLTLIDTKLPSVVVNVITLASTASLVLDSDNENAAIERSFNVS